MFYVVFMSFLCRFMSFYVVLCCLSVLLFFLIFFIFFYLTLFNLSAQNFIFILCVCGNLKIKKIIFFFIKKNYVL